MENTLESTLEEKNKLVESLRDYLTSLYNTEDYYTLGEEDYEAREEKGVYYGSRRDPRKPKDLTGFCFRRDFMVKGDESKIYENIRKFLSKQKNVESRFDKKELRLTTKVGNEEYLVDVSINEDYPMKVTVEFFKLSF